MIVGLITAIGFEGGHMWIESQMHQGTDDDAKRWGWEPERWTGGENGGTSASLGLIGRHLVRAAWFTLHYSSPFGVGSAISSTSGDSGALNLTDRDLQQARVYLEMALDKLQTADGKLHLDRVALELLERHASVLERIGTRAALVRAREDSMLIHDGRVGEPFAQAHIAVKLGNISERLGDNEAALAWWMRGINLTQLETGPTTSAISGPSTPTSTDSGSSSSSAPPSLNNISSKLRNWIHSEDSNASLEVPTEILAPPTSPIAQRTLVAALVSMSAFYSRRGMLKEAMHIEEDALSLIDKMVPSGEVSQNIQSVGQLLHNMFLMHRKSILAIHHAEVTYAQRASSRSPKKVLDPLTDLLTAASLSEIVAQVLTGKSSVRPESTSYLNSKSVTTSPSELARPPAAKGELDSLFEKSAAIRLAARRILRDSWLTATEAWDLAGVLYRETKDGKVKAAECFARALAWAGEPNSGRHEGLGMTGWESLWKRYVEARDLVGQEGGTAKGQKSS